MNLETKKTYEIIVKEVTHTQYEKKETFYVLPDGTKKYWSDDEKAKNTTELTGEILWSEDTETVYEQKVTELDLESVIAVVNRL